MSKAKMFGGMAVVFAVVMGLLAWFVVDNGPNKSFMDFLLFTYLPVLLVTLALAALVIGILLLIYG